MLTSSQFIRHSLETHLFLARIMKEHLIFAAASLTPKNADLMEQALNLKGQFETFLAEVTTMANGVISPEASASGQFVTPFTLRAEQVTQLLTGIPIATGITQAEAALTTSPQVPNIPMLEQRVSDLNQRSIQLITTIIKVKTMVRDEVLSCRLFTHLYPLLLEHVLREAHMYLEMVQMLQQRQEIDTLGEVAEHEAFWNDIISEHAKFIRGMLDPTEDELINKANNFAKLFDMLELEAERAENSPALVPEVTAKSLKATKEIRDFKAQGTRGALECKIRSVALPLLNDHVLREASHYLHDLKEFQQR